MAKQKNSWDNFALRQFGKAIEYIADSSITNAGKEGLMYLKN